MLKNFVVETVNAPGTTQTIPLLGAVAGRVTFKAAGFATGEQTFYFMEDGAAFEAGVGVLTHGSPDTYNRQTVLANSAGTTARINFAGTTRLYNEVPAQRALWKDAAGALDMESRLLSSLFWGGNSTGLGSAYVVAMPKTVTAYAGGFEFKFRAHATCTVNPTINAGQGAKGLYRPVSTGLAPVQAGEIVAGQLVHVLYDPTTTTFVLVGPPPGGLSARVGDYVFGAWQTLPPGCLWPDGRNVSRTTYAVLFAAIGTTHGVGDGSTTFTLPDVRGRALFARDDLGGTAANRITVGGAGFIGTVLGAAGGSQWLHAHGHGLTDPGHSHGNSPTGGNVAYANQGAFFVYPATTGGGNFIGYGTLNVTDVSGTGISVQSNGGGSSQNVPPGIVANVAIYAGAS